VPITFQCPHCGSQTQVEDRFAGQSGPCRSCGATITIPGPAGAAAYPTAPRGSSASTASMIVIIAVVVGVVGLLLAGVLAALLVPAVGAARDAARRTQCMNNVKQIGLAMQMYADTYRTFPPAYTVDAAGKPMHSWRVLLLPYLEGGPLYDQYRMDEPWDGPNNSQLAGLMPAVFRCPSEAATPGSTTTVYAVVNGPGAVFDGDKLCTLASVTDGLSNTLVVVEAAGANIHWMEPRDLDFTQLQGVINGTGGNEIASHHPGMAVVGFADGSVRALPSSVQPTVVRALITRAGGEPIPADY
jgi:prepilin-type processing-associated H-X9-DG protein